MFEIGVGDSSSPSGMPIRGSRDSGLDFDDVLYREAMSEMDNADDYISRDYHTDYSGRSPSIADTIEDDVSMPRKGGVQNQFIEDSRSSDQTTVIEEDKPEPDQWCVPKTTSISYTIPLSIKFVLQALHFFFFIHYNATIKLLVFSFIFYVFRRPYDIFQVSEREFEDDDYFFKEILKGIRLFLYFFFVIIIIACIVASKLSLLLLTSGINKVRPPLCFFISF